MLIASSRIGKRLMQVLSIPQDQEHLKPQIVHALSNAELYCLALANIYSDPNYHNQNHTGILASLARKGVAVPEPTSTSLTETILIQNSPLKMVTHISFARRERTGKLLSPPLLPPICG